MFNRTCRLATAGPRLEATGYHWRVTTTELGFLLPASAQAVASNVKALLPLVAEEADEIEQKARLTSRVEQAMTEAGVFEMGFPAKYGGLELTIEQQVEVVAEVSSIDASAGWNIGVLNAGGVYAGRLGPKAYAELYPIRHLTCGSFHPRGRAEQVDGGYMVSGNWDWGSGLYSAEHMVSGCLVFDSDGNPVPGSRDMQMHIGVWLPKEHIEPLDNWQTLGVRGSGSSSYTTPEPVFVPIEHSFDREAEFDPDADPLNKEVTACHYALTGVVLGLARQAVRIAGEVVRSRIDARGAASLDSATAQILGQMMGDVDFAYAGVREIARMTDEIIFSDATEMPAFHVARMTAANATAAETLRRVLTPSAELAGAGHIFDSHPMQRVLRDAHSALAHIGTRRLNWAAHAAEALADPDQGYTVPDDPADGGFRSWV